MLNKFVSTIKDVSRRLLNTLPEVVYFMDSPSYLYIYDFKNSNISSIINNAISRAQDGRGGRLY
jgi:hypothetical protein